MIKAKITNLLLILSVAIFLFGSGYKLGEYKTSASKMDRQDYSILNGKPNDKTSKLSNLDFSLFWQTWDKVEQKFIDKKKLDPQKMLYGAIKGMVSALDDPYTFFLTPEENKTTKDDLGGKFEGIGAQLGMKDNRIIVIAPLKNSPAEQAGMKAGDFIIKVDEQSTKGWSLPQAVSKIRGKKGTKVKLTVEREGTRLEKEIVRDQINVASVELSYEQKASCSQDCKKVAYLKINQFGEATKTEWDKAVDEIQSRYSTKSIEGLVLDLRDNPGGYLNGSVYLASEFLPIGKLIVKQESTTIESKEYLSDRSGKLRDIPMVILINKGSASASEILSGSLRDHKRAALIGEKTFGKGSVQEAIDLEKGAGLHVTVAKWILPSGEWINSKGIEPSIKVENTPKDGNTLTRKEDKQLDRAIDELIK